MEADDPSAARDAAVSPSNETASESFAEPETSASSLGISEELGPFGAENVSGSYLSDGYQEDHAEEISSNRGKVGGASGSIDYNEQEPMEFLSIPGPPQPSTGDGANPPGQQQEGQNADPQALAVVIDRSAAVSAAKMSSEASSSIAPLSVGVPAMEEEVYSGMPKVDADIEVGKNIVRRRKLSAACPPSSLYADVQPPGMEMVQRALRNHKTTIQPFKKQQPRYQATEYHDERGHMLLYGSLDGKYVGDVLGGLPHGHGQHWTPSPGGKAAPGYRHLLYEGAWKYGAKCGFGRMFYHNGQEYRGYFKEGQRHGRGAIRYADGTVYDGDWFKGRRHGLGTTYYKDGGFYKGAWCKDNRDGWGAYYWPNKCRKYEGEWVGDDPVCGNHTKIQESDYMALKNLIPEWCNVQGYFPANLPKETLELPAMELRYPESVYYPHACGRRQERIDIKQAAEKHPPDPKIVVEHKGSLTPQQMKALRLAFDKLSPGYYRRSMVNRIQIRRMILLARLDPDSEMLSSLELSSFSWLVAPETELNSYECRPSGKENFPEPCMQLMQLIDTSVLRKGKRLFVALQEAAIPTVGLTYNNLMKTLLKFQYPREPATYTRNESLRKE